MRKFLLFCLVALNISILVNSTCLPLLSALILPSISYTFAEDAAYPTDQSADTATFDDSDQPTTSTTPMSCQNSSFGNNSCSISTSNCTGATTSCKGPEEACMECTNPPPPPIEGCCPL